MRPHARPNRAFWPPPRGWAAGPIPVHPLSQIYAPVDRARVAAARIDCSVELADNGAGGVPEVAGALGVDAGQVVQPADDQVDGEADVADVAVVLGVVGAGQDVAAAGRVPTGCTVRFVGDIGITVSSSQILVRRSGAQRVDVAAAPYRGQQTPVWACS